MTLLLNQSTIDPPLSPHFVEFSSRLRRHFSVIGLDMGLVDAALPTGRTGLDAVIGSSIFNPSALRSPFAFDCYQHGAVAPDRIIIDSMADCRSILSKSSPLERHCPIH